MNEAEQFLLYIELGKDIQKRITEQIKGIQDYRKLQLIYGYIRAMNKVK